MIYSDLPKYILYDQVNAYITQLYKQKPSFQQNQPNGFILLIYSMAIKKGEEQKKTSILM